MTTNRIKTIAYWTTTILGPASFIMGGVMQASVRPGDGRAWAPVSAVFLTILGV